MTKIISVIKASGEVEPFSEKKVIGSLTRAGASSELAQKIVSQVKPYLYLNIPTFEIYSAVMKILRKEKKDLAERYNLKKAIMELGPSGYPFERFVSAVLKENGYQVETNQVILGKCVSHEIDISAVKQRKFMIECKFHNQAGGRCDIKDALYTYARFLDLQNRGFALPWLITNTKVTQDVKTYAACVGMQITAWDYPAGESLREIVDQSKLYPVTAMTSLTKDKKRELLDRGLVFCRDLDKQPKAAAANCFQG